MNLVQEIRKYLKLTSLIRTTSPYLQFTKVSFPSVLILLYKMPRFVAEMASNHALLGAKCLLNKNDTFSLRHRADHKGHVRNPRELT